MWKLGLASDPTNVAPLRSVSDFRDLVKMAQKKFKKQKPTIFSQKFLNSSQHKAAKGEVNQNQPLSRLEAALQRLGEALGVDRDLKRGSEKPARTEG